MAQKVALVAGALGVVGRALLTHLEGRTDWQVIGLSRRTPDFPTRARFLRIDLGKRETLTAQAGELAAVTHVFHTAYQATLSQAEDVAANLPLLVNLMEVLEPVAPNLRHVQLVHGSKWYGCHLGPYKTPAVEDDPRIVSPIWYYDQQDWLEAFQRGKRWTWSALRPHGICGFAVGSPISQLTILAAYGAISAELGVPLRFPGKPGAFHAIYQLTEARHLAAGMLWTAEAPACANQAFNFTNGDFVRWRNLWPGFARFFGVPDGPPQPVNLTAFMRERAALWDRMVAQHGLKPYRLSELANGAFGDWLYSTDYDIMSSMTKLRQAGWTGVVDSEEMYLRLLGELRRDRIIP
ncbi:MAG: SDR family oxidoreductase [Alphaproteobacteria bacterium]|nr:SDR family oxidoreductase [Alphaproteobacteria bacterium]